MKKILARFRTESGIPVFFQNQCEDIHFPEETEIAIIRVAQESLKNICKHSQAETVRILLRQLPDSQCMMLIEDDGIGFDCLPEREHAHGVKSATRGRPVLYAQALARRAAREKRPDPLVGRHPPVH